MRYHLLATPRDDTAHAEELGRLVRFAKGLTVTFVTVGPPHRAQMQTSCLLDVPDRFADHAERVLSIVTGRDDAAVPTSRQVKPRREWTQTTLLFAQAGAQPLDGTLLAGAASAQLTVRYDQRGVQATLRYTPTDTALVDKAAALGWRVVAKPAGLARLLPNATVSIVPSLRWCVAADVTAPPALPVAAQGTDAAVTGATLLLPRVSPLLAANGQPGFLLGAATDGTGVQLTWQSQQITLIAPADRTRTALIALVGRALGTGMGVVVQASRDVLRDDALAPFAARIRTLDGLDLWESAAIPWRDIAPALLIAVLQRHGISAAMPWPPPEFFGDMLARAGAARLATTAVLGLTAPPGDDLRGVLAAGGGVTLIDDGDAGSALLTDLLLTHLAEAPAGQRPLLIIRRPGVVVPLELAVRAVQIVLGPEATAAELRFVSPGDGWRLTFADGCDPVNVLTDLTMTPLNMDADYHGRIIAGLTDAPETTLDAADDEAWYAGAPLEQLAEPVLPDDEPAATPWESLAALALDADDTVAPSVVAEPLELIAPTVVPAPVLLADDTATDAWDTLATAAMAVAALPVMNDDLPDDEVPFSWASEDAALPADDAAATIGLALFDDGMGGTDDVYSAEPWTTSDTDMLMPVSAIDVDLLGGQDSYAVRATALPEGRASRRPRPSLPRRMTRAVDAAPSDGAAIGDELAVVLADSWQDTPILRVAPVSIVGGAPHVPTADGLFLGDVPTAPRLRDVFAEGHASPASPVVLATTDHGLDAHSSPTEPAPAPVHADADDALRAAWHAGVGFADLVRRMHDNDPTTSRDQHRIRLRAVLAAPQPAPLLPGPFPVEAAPQAVAEALVWDVAAPTLPMFTDRVHAAQAEDIQVFVAQPALGDDSPESLWADWIADIALEDMIKARCGYTRGVAANRVRDRIYRLVIPRIVAELDAAALVQRLCEGRKPLKTQSEVHETLLRRTVRQQRPVTGSLRESMHDRIVLVMRDQVMQPVEV